MLGIIIALFMAGLAAGSQMAKRIFPNGGSRAFIGIQWGIAAYCFLLPPILLGLQRVRDLTIVVNAAICLLAFAVAVLIGLEFSLAAMMRKGGVQRVASELYGIDLIGSALGALLAGAYLIPAVGLLPVSFIAGSLSLLSSLAAFAGRKSYDGSTAWEHE